MAKSFTLEYWLDEGWYVGRSKEAPGIFSQGQTLAELKSKGIELKRHGKKHDIYLNPQSSKKAPSPDTKKLKILYVF